MINKLILPGMFALIVVGCANAYAHRTTTTSGGSLEQQPESARVATKPPNDSVLRSRPIVRALYANRSAGQNLKKMHHLIAIADTTEINAFVIDIKDEFGINYSSADTMVKRNAGRGGIIPGMQPLLDTLDFTAGKRNWGYQLRAGLIEISRHDFDLIAEAMHASIPAATTAASP